MNYLVIFLAFIAGAFAGVAKTPEAVAVKQSVVLPSPTPVPTASEIVSEIAYVFRKEPTHVIVLAVKCFYSESGLRHDAVSKTNDHGVAQINLWYHDLDDPYDYKKNIAKAYEIYKKRGNFSAWYGKGCLGE